MLIFSKKQLLVLWIFFLLFFCLKFIPALIFMMPCLLLALELISILTSLVSSIVYCFKISSNYFHSLSFPLSTALAASYKFCYIIFSFSLKYFIISLGTFSLIHGLLRSVLFNFEMFQNFSDIWFNSIMVETIYIV